MFFISICLSVLLTFTEGNIIPFNSSFNFDSKLNSSLTPRLNPSNSFLTTFNYDVSSCSCSGTDNLRYNGIWTSWNNQRGSRPDNAVYSGYDSSSGAMYVMRVQFNNYGLITGKYSAEVKGAWIPYGGYEYGGFANFEILRHSNYIWEGNKNNPNLWIPGGKTSSGSIIYICSVFHVINPGQVYPMAINIPGKYDGGRCYVSYAGLEYGYDQAGSGSGSYQILKRKIKKFNFQNKVEMGIKTKDFF